MIRELLPGKKRYNEIQKALSGISPKVLATRLRHLQSHGLVKRTAYPTIPPTTEYTLTPQGQKLEKVLQAMAEFGTDLVEIEATHLKTKDMTGNSIGPVSRS